MTTWNAMTVAGIALIAGGVATLVVMVWGLGGSRQNRRESVPAARRGRSERRTVAAGTVPAASGDDAFGRSGVAIRDIRQPWPVDGPVEESGDPQPRAPRRRLRRRPMDDDGIAEAGPVRGGSYGLASLGLADDPVPDDDPELLDSPGAADDDVEPDQHPAEQAGDLDPGDLDPGDLDPGDLDPGDLDPGDLDPDDLDPADVPDRVRNDGPDAGRDGAMRTPGPDLEPALHEFAHLGSVRATATADRDTGGAARASRHHDDRRRDDEGGRGPARSSGYRYGDRVQGWVRPDYHQRSVDREAPPAGEYWLPFDNPSEDPYADSGYGEPGYGVAPREVSPYEPVPHDVVPHTMSSHEIAPSVEPMPAPPYDAGPPMQGPPTQGWSMPGRPATRSRHAQPVEPPETGSPEAGSQPAGPQETEPPTIWWTVPDESSAEPDGSAGPLTDADTEHSRQFPRRRRAATRRTRTDPGSVAEQSARPRNAYPRGETRRRIPTDVVGITGETTQKLPSKPVVEGPEAERRHDAEPAGRPRPRPRPRPSGTAQIEDRQPQRSTVYISRHAADPG